MSSGLAFSSQGRVVIPGITPVSLESIDDVDAVSGGCA